MTTIILHGYLKSLYPNEIRVEANSAAEALQSLSLIPALRKKSGERHLVQVEGFESEDALYDKREIDVLHVRPIMMGAGGKNIGIGQIVIGIIMVAVGIYTWNPQLIISGVMMILGGVLQLMAPQPRAASIEDRSRYLGNGRNTVAIGTRIPMIYGRRKAYGQYISFDIDAGYFDAAPAEWYSSPFTNYGDLNYSAAPVDLPISNPQVSYKQPTSDFAGLTYTPAMVDRPETFINFTPIQLLAGDYDINFATGHTLHVRNQASGLTSIVLLLGGEIFDLPPNGTPIVFTQNYG